MSSVSVEAGHPVGLELHAGLQVLLGDLLEIGGEIVAGEGVLLAADLGDEFRELALGMLLGALEHQMLEEMGDARLARRIVGRAVAVPDHMGDDGGAMIGNDDDVEAVGEGEMRDLGRWRRHETSSQPVFRFETLARDEALTRPNRDDPATYKAPPRSLRVGWRSLPRRRKETD